METMSDEGRGGTNWATNFSFSTSHKSAHNISEYYKFFFIVNCLLLLLYVRFQFWIRQLMHKHFLPVLFAIVMLMSRSYEFARRPIELASRSSEDSNGAKCNGQERRVYLRNEGGGGAGPKHVLRGLSLQECADKCTTLGENRQAPGPAFKLSHCRSFEYDSEKLVCTMLATDSVSSVGLTPSYQKKLSLDYPTTAHFHAICLPIEYSSCRSAHLFERYPQHILIGHALEVRPVSDLSECLAACLEAKHLFRLDCHSVMFFHESSICVLNRESRKSVGHGMFREERGPGSQPVDYLENICVDVECPGSISELHWVRTENFRIDPSRELLLEQKYTLEKCQQMCRENRLVDGSPFPCKAFVHSISSGQCQLSAVSDIQRKSSDAIASTDSDGVSYALQTGQQELSAFSAGHYHEKVCLPLMPLPRGICNESASFELFPGKALNISSVDQKIVSANTLSECLLACLLLNSTITCRSVQFRRDRDECLLSSFSQFSHPHLFHSAPFVDYFDNLCSPPFDDHSIMPVSTPLPKSDDDGQLANQIAEKRKRERPEMEEIGGEDGENREEEEAQNNGTKLEKNGEYEREEGQNGVISSECRLNGISINARFRSPASGTLFLRDHPGKCSAIFNSALMAVLVLPFQAVSNETISESDQHCPGTRSGPNQWSYMVVLHQNNNGEQSMESQERVFNVTCDFNDIPRSRQITRQSASIPFNISSDNNLDPDSNCSDTDSVRISGSPVPPHLRLKMALLRNGHPVDAVKLGEELELRWTFEDQTESKKLDMFVQSCTAERIDGEPPEPPPLELIANGCPDPKVRSAHLIGQPQKWTRSVGGGFNTSLRVFRFDGSRRVRIRCEVIICVEKCEPAKCDDEKREQNEDDEGQTDKGKRRKRDDIGVATLGELAEIVEGYNRIREEALPLSEEEEMTKKKKKIKKKPPKGQQQQQSATISGSYTIMDKDEGEDEEDEQEEQDGERGREMGQQKKPLKRVNILRGGKERKEEVEGEKEDDDELMEEKRGGGRGGKEELIRMVGNRDRKEEEGQQQKLRMIPMVVTEEPERKKKKTEERGRTAGREGGRAEGCEQGDSSPSLCIGRSAAIMALIILVTLSTCQCFQIGRYLRKKWTKKREPEVKAEEIAEEHPPAPISAPISALDNNSSAECGFNGAEYQNWHKTNALCAQEHCQHCQWNSTNSPSTNLNWRRPTSYLSWADEDEFGERERFRQQTVFPAEPIHQSRKRIMEPV